MIRVFFFYLSLHKSYFYLVLLRIYAFPPSVFTQTETKAAVFGHFLMGGFYKSFKG